MSVYLKRNARWWSFGAFFGTDLIYSCLAARLYTQCAYKDQGFISFGLPQLSSGDTFGWLLFSKRYCTYHGKKTVYARDHQKLPCLLKTKTNALPCSMASLGGLYLRSKLRNRLLASAIPFDTLPVSAIVRFVMDVRHFWPAN